MSKEKNKVNVTQALVNFDGKEMKEATPRLDDDGKPVYVVNPNGSFFTGPDGQRVQEKDDRALTLRSVVTNALMFTPDNERRTLTGTTRVERFILAQEIQKNDVVMLTAQEVLDILKLVNALYPTPVVAATSLILDPNCAKTKTNEVPDALPS